jgi:hypothetical protein
MPATPELYRDHAAECLRIAQQTEDREIKARLLAMAEAWRRLAESSGKPNNA